MIKVQFHDIDEFFTEVMQTVGASVLRVHVERIYTDHEDLQRFEVAAGLVNESGQIVELVLSCGNTSPGSDGPRRSQMVAEDIRKRAGELGFNVRGGRFLSAEVG